MTATGFLGYFFAVTCVLAALYVSFSKDLLRVSLAFFIEIGSVGGVLLSLNNDYLALVMFSISLIGTALVITFSSVIMGGLKESLRGEGRQEGAGRGLLPRLLGLGLGWGVGGAIGWAFLTSPFLDKMKLPEAAREATDTVVLGKMMLGDHIAVFEVLGVMILLVVVGGGLLLRKPTDAA